VVPWYGVFPEPDAFTISPDMLMENVTHMWCLPRLLTSVALFFPVLGNHDYRGDALAQLSQVLRKIDSRFICMKSFIVSAGTVNILFPLKDLGFFNS
jgi:uncharacterized membrane protein